MAGEAAAGGGYGGYAGAASAIGGLISQIMQGAPDNSAYKEQRDLMRRQRRYQEASVDPTHPWARALSGQIRQQLQQDAAASIMADLIRKQRMRARGYGAALGNPARQDEARSGALAKAFQQAGTIAREEAARKLSAAGGNPAHLTANMCQYAEQDLAQCYAKNQTQTNQVMGAPYIAAGLANLFKQLFGGEGGDGSTYGTDNRRSGMNPQTNQMIWNPYGGSTLGGGV